VEEEEEELWVQKGPGVNEVSFRARPYHNVHRTLGVDTGDHVEPYISTKICKRVKIQDFMNKMNFNFWYLSALKQYLLRSCCIRELLKNI
jgi:hypothetical protein